MLRLTTLVFWLAGICDGVQRLTCPYELKDEDLPRVWCKETSPQCCSGFSFSRESQSLDAGRLKVTQGVGSFIVDVQCLAQGEGMYWCGVLSSNKTIIKLAEEYFYSGSYVWDILRWILMPLLPMAIIFSYCYLKRKDQNKKEKGVYMNITMISDLAQNNPHTEEEITELE
ncbi:uncharacterized protein si:ch211-102c2.4 [Oncorhynchus mykiss]|uniref:uncharacterized protein si:ch211-102c2.4 n=1 Tax=Oncorhynchus mykiss TaxID=8022 RepID=UPI001878877B|nr:uncharacterized protein si:ch211-102c2.4 [Oncorhynchus mykiss]